MDPEDILEAADTVTQNLLHRLGITEPPVDALSLSAAFGFQIEYVDPEEEEAPREYGDRPRRRPSASTLQFRFDQSEESQHLLAARAVAGKLVPEALTKIGIAPGTESRQGRSHMIQLLTSRVLLPGRWYASDCRKLGFDLFALKERYANVGYELLATRMLEVTEDPLVIAIVDDGVVSVRRGNRFQVNKKLTPGEQSCCDQIEQTDQPARFRSEEWSVWGWPTPGVPFRRIILRAVPEEIY